jgi:hypothetical protein
MAKKLSSLEAPSQRVVSLDSRRGKYNLQVGQLVMTQIKCLKKRI